MFIWDFVADTVLGQITDWVYGQIVGFLGSFFAQMGNMGADLFEMEWVQAIVMFFSCLAWALYVTGLVVAGFECGIEYQNGRGSIRETGVNALKGFFCGKLVFDRAGGAVPPVCIAAGKSDAWPERFRGDIWGGGAADTFLAKGCRDLAGSSCVGRVWRDICSRQPDFNDIPFDLDGICGHKGVFCKFKKGRHPSHPDFCWKPLSVQCPAGIYRWIYQLVQAGGRAVPDSFFAGSDPDRRADGSKGPCAVGDGADVIGRGSPPDRRAVWAGYNNEG